MDIGEMEICLVGVLRQSEGCNNVLYVLISVYQQYTDHILNIFWKQKDLLQQSEN